MDKKELEIAYGQYIDQHVDNVYKVWEVVEEALVREGNIDMVITNLVDNSIYFHDYSKYTFDEFDGYRQWFYPADGEVKDLEEFQLAWNHHQKSNPHHWEYWCLIRTTEVIPLDMPEEHIIEMLCDWSAMSLKLGDTPSEFYKNNHTQMIFTKNTRAKVEQLLPLFDKAVKKQGGRK